MGLEIFIKNVKYYKRLCINKWSSFKKQLYQITQSSYFIAAKTKGIIWKQHTNEESKTLQGIEQC